MSDTSSPTGAQPAEAPAPQGDGSDAGAEGPSRGFFSRILGALSPSAPESPDHTASGPAASNAQATAFALKMPGIANLRRMRVEDVAVPKADIVAVEVGLNFDDVVTAFRDSGLTRIPVYDQTLDHPLGMVNLKDFALRYGFNGAPADFDLKASLRPLLYVPPSMPLAMLLHKMQAERIHMALVIDEYGGTDGLVTIEDLLETVVGAIDDEHDDDEEPEILREREGVWVVKASVAIEEFARATGIDLAAHEEVDDEEVDTLGGLVFMLSGHVPVRGEIVRHPDGPEFEVVDADPRRILRLRVRARPPEIG